MQHSYRFNAQLYVAERDCIDPLAPIAEMTGKDHGAGCGVTCLATRSDASRALYVVTACPPYPETFEAPPDDRCAAALSAFARGSMCNRGSSR